MPGTTPVYGFPYPEPTDLVADYPALGQDLAEDIEAVLPTIGGLSPTAPTSLANTGGTATLTSNTVTFTGTTSVSLNGCFTGDYNNYRVLVHMTQGGGSQDQYAYLKLRASGTDSSASYWVANGTGYTDNSLTLVNANTNVTTGFLVGRLANTVDNQTFAALDFNRPYLAARTVLAGMGMWTLGGSGITAAAIPISGLHGVATAYDGFTISCAAALTGNVSVYGYKK